jgi:hypothetical protein
MSDYPLAMYHTAVKRPRNAFGRLVEGGEPVHTGDVVDPGYHVPIAQAHALNEGQQVGDAYFIPKHHYCTIMCVKYEGSKVDELASKKYEEELTGQGWVRNPNDLKEEYDETDK